MGFIYIIRNTINTKVYVGQTKKSIQQRFRQHVYEANRGCHYVIHKAMRKYGIDNFYIQPIEQCDDSLLNDKEIYWIKFYKSNNPKYGYNMTEGGSRQGDPWNKSRVDDITLLNAFNNGLSAYNIAKKYHTTVSRVTSVLNKFGIKYGKALQITPENIERQIVDLYLKGYASSIICKYFKLNKTTVLHILERYHIKRRTTKETRLLGRNLPKLI